MLFLVTLSDSSQVPQEARSTEVSSSLEVRVVRSNMSIGHVKGRVRKLLESWEIKSEFKIDVVSSVSEIEGMYIYPL